VWGVWPLHDIVITNIVWCIAYTREVGRGVVHCQVNPKGKKINRSHTHTPTENNTPDTHTYTRQEELLNPGGAARGADGL